MVKRFAVALLLGLSLIGGATARADPGPTADKAPAVAEEFQKAAPSEKSVVARYQPTDLKFYSEPGGLTPSGMKRSAQGTVSDMLAAVEGMLAQVVVLTVRLLDLAWNVNLSRALMPSIGSIATRFSGLLWGFGGLLTVMVAGWIVVQVATGAYTRLTAGLGVVVLVVALGFLTYDGIGGIVASADDLSTEISAKILAPPGSAGFSDSVQTMTDSIYAQLILEPWARANFKDLETAGQYTSEDGMPGGQFWNLSEEDAGAVWDRAKSDKKTEDLLPWHDNPVGRRLGVVFNTFLSILFVVPMLFLFGALVVGAKGVTFALAALWPVAAFCAAVPWWRGTAFLRGYAVWACLGPILKTAIAFVLAVVLAFTGGLMDSAAYIPGGMVAVTLFIGAFTFVVYLMSKPMGRWLRGLIFKSPAQQAAETEAAHRAREMALMEQRSVRAAVMSNGQQQVLAAWSETQMRAFQFREAAVLSTAGVQMRPGHTGRRMGALQTYGTVQDFRPRHYRALPVTAQHAAPHGVLHGGTEYGLQELMREARRFVDAMARAAANAGGGGRR